MRLRSLNLHLFGHFAGKSYDFGSAGTGEPDFHIIYGPNEAGKTTTMEAYLRLLYGFDAREAYDFQHQRKNLRISGTFETEQGDLSLSRLPTRNASLQDAHGAPLPEAAIAAHLGGLGADDYRSLLCLDDDTIERGGEEIANSHGDIGRLLFSAAAGVSDLSQVLDSVDAEANALFLKRSSKTEMAQLKKELADVSAQIKAQDVPASTYRKLRQTLAAAEVTQDQTNTQRTALMAQLAQVKAQQNAMPLLLKLEQLDAALAEMPDYPMHLNVAPEDLVQLLTTQSQANHDMSRLTQERDAHKVTLAQIDLDPNQLGLRQALDDLDAARSRFATAQLDLPRRIETRDTIIKDMQRAAVELGATCDPVQLVVSPAALTELETARDTLRTSAHDLDTGSRELTRLADRVALAEDSTTQSARPNDTAIGDILDRFSVDSFALTYATAQHAINSAKRDLAAALAALAINGQTFTQVPTSAVAVPEIAAHAEKHAELDRKITQAKDDLDQMRADHAAQNAQIKAQRGAGALIDDTEAQAAITLRDTAWKAHRASMTDTTADAFEAALKKTDANATQRLTRADEIGQLRQLSQNAAQTAARIAQHTERLARLASEQAAITTQLATTANDMGITAAPAPLAFAQWANLVTTAEAAAQHLRALEQDHAATLDKADRLINALSQHIAQDAPDFETLVAAARQRAKIARDQDADQKANQRALDDLRAELKKRQEHCAALTKTAQDAQKAWHNLVAEHLQEHVQADRLVLSFEPLRTLRELNGRHSTAARQVATMQDDQAQFVRAISTLTTQHAVRGDDPLSAFSTLASLADEARAQEDRSAMLRQEIDTGAEQIAQAQRVIDDIARKVAALGAQFPVDIPSKSIDDLRRAVAGTQDAVVAHKDRKEIAAQISLLLGTSDLAQARDALTGQTATNLAATAMRVQGDLDAIETQYRAAIAARAEAARDLNAVTGDDSVAALVARKTTVELAIQDVALRYVKLRAGHVLAQEAIRRYRDKHRSGMMEATQVAFRELTNGAYTALQTQAQGTNETLIAIDASGRAKHAQDMSKGTRFQLYLALRAAAYEQLADQGTCLPFFCDDIFETFDEARTKSACKMMARIGRRGQAIYLTHHQHVVDIARATCGDGVRVHEI
ncbi:YhaN family protein [Yoonia sp. I 8.24]|uniref:YhaN family protein n=1 Tax=Yoonia sp. I 8.24 TaxID=1537229 RepID=UPI001EDEE62D|nr:YhaN family protein [Yoonia sp. I 8.24]MCG3268049.1 AAA family ATPase [Yoonia sp. I 8.24]